MAPLANCSGMTTLHRKNAATHHNSHAHSPSLSGSTFVFKRIKINHRKPEYASRASGVGTTVPALWRRHAVGFDTSSVFFSSGAPSRIMSTAVPSPASTGSVGAGVWCIHISVISGEEARGGGARRGRARRRGINKYPDRYDRARARATGLIAGQNTGNFLWHLHV